MNGVARFQVVFAGIKPLGHSFYIKRTLKHRPGLGLMSNEFVFQGKIPVI